MFCARLDSRKSGRKDVLLVEWLARGRPDPQEVTVALYGRPNLNAYHSLRKRLQTQAISFLASIAPAMKVGEEDPVREKLTAARMMISNGMFHAARAVLVQAEREAIQSARPVELDEVYRLFIRHAGEMEIDPNSFLEPWKANRIRIERLRQLEMANALLNARLKELRKSGRVADLDEIARLILSSVKIDREVANDVSFMFILCSMVRNAVISSKDYYRFESFVGRVFRGFIRTNAFGKHPEELAGFHYMLAHVLYRNRKFAEAIEQLNTLHVLIHSAGRRLSHLRPKYLLLRAAVKSYSGDNEDAVRELGAAIKDKGLRLLFSDRLNLLLNLSVYHFQSARFMEAQQSIRLMNHTDSWLEKHMGVEWTFKKNLIEAIVLVELGKDTNAISRLRYIETHYRNFFSQPIYQRAKVFTGFIRQMVENPDVVRDPKFAQRVERSNMGLPGNREDIQAITFYCWMKSKMQGTNYYEELLQAMNSSFR